MAIVQKYEIIINIIIVNVIIVIVVVVGSMITEEM